MPTSDPLAGMAVPVELVMMLRARPILPSAAQQAVAAAAIDEVPADELAVRCAALVSIVANTLELQAARVLADPERLAAAAAAAAEGVPYGPAAVGLDGATALRAIGARIARTTRTGDQP